jgi:hypothetical protein
MWRDPIDRYEFHRSHISVMRIVCDEGRWKKYAHGHMVRQITVHAELKGEVSPMKVEHILTGNVPPRPTSMRAKRRKKLPMTE